MEMQSPNQVCKSHTEPSSVKTHCRAKLHNSYCTFCLVLCVFLRRAEYSYITKKGLYIELPKLTSEETVVFAPLSF